MSVSDLGIDFCSPENASFDSFTVVSVAPSVFIFDFFGSSSFPINRRNEFRRDLKGENVT